MQTAGAEEQRRQSHSRCRVKPSHMPCPSSTPCPVLRLPASSSSLYFSSCSITPPASCSLQYIPGWLWFKMMTSRKPDSLCTSPQAFSSLLTPGHLRCRPARPEKAQDFPLWILFLLWMLTSCIVCLFSSWLNKFSLSLGFHTAYLSSESLPTEITSPQSQCWLRVPEEKSWPSLLILLSLVENRDNESTPRLWMVGSNKKEVHEL